MRLRNILIGTAIGGVIAYLILKPSTKTLIKYGNSSGNGEAKEDLTKHFSN